MEEGGHTMPISVRAIPRSVHAMSAMDEAAALENLLSQSESAGRLVQVIDSMQEKDHLLAIFQSN
jgi:hypothetical protein